MIRQLVLALFGLQLLGLAGAAPVPRGHNEPRFDDGLWNPTKYDKPGLSNGPTAPAPAGPQPATPTPPPVPDIPIHPVGGVKGPHNVIYTLTGGLPSNLGGFNTLMLAFWTTDGIFGAAAEWAALSPQDRAARLNAYHDAGIRVMVAAFGANDLPTGRDPVAVAAQIADYVNSYQLDGVDIDYEDTAALYGGSGAGWVSTLTRELKNRLPGKLISHAPQSPYFNSGGGYDAVHAAVGDLIDFYNVQYYNQGGDEGCAASIAGVSRLLAAGIPGDKIVFGKPLTPIDANTGYLSPAELATCLSNRPDGWSGSVMFWQWHEGDAPNMFAAIAA